MAWKWWEKTVEYQFILTAARKGKLFAMPLDGNLERGGDGLFSSAEQWLLIEFKVDQTALKSEEAKFCDYQKASQALAKEDGHHLLVYGGVYEREDGRTAFSLFFQPYFSGQVGLKWDGRLPTGIGIDSFLNYLDALIQFKKLPSGGGGQKISVGDYAMVAGVSADGELVACLQMDEFRHEVTRLQGLELECEYVPEYESEIDGP